MTTNTLQNEFKTKILPALQKELGIKNSFAVPQLTKVKIAVGFGKTARKGGSSNTMDESKIKQISQNIATITGQKPRNHISKKAISNFKLRAGMPIGTSVTLRGKRMFDFIGRLVNITLPRVRDFRGISLKSFDGQGNYSLGIKDYTVFPEIKPEDAEANHGLQITVATTAKNNNEGKALLFALGFPFIKPEKKKVEKKAEIPEEVKKEMERIAKEKKEADKKSEEKKVAKAEEPADKKSDQKDS